MMASYEIILSDVVNEFTCVYVVFILLVSFLVWRIAVFSVVILRDCLRVVLFLIVTYQFKV